MKPYRVNSGTLRTMDAWMNDPRFIDLNRVVSHGANLGLTMAKQGEPVDAAVVQYVHDRVVTNLWGELLGLDDADITAVMTKFESEIWPHIMSHFKCNHGAYQFLKEFGVWSPRLIMFLVDSWLHPGLSMLPAQVLAHDPITDDIVELGPDDSLFPFCFDQTFRMINYRMGIERELCLSAEAKTVVTMGAGLLLPFLTHGYPLGHDGQRIIAYDTDATLVPYIEKMLGGKLEDYGIDYRVGDFADGLDDEELFGKVDRLLYGGLFTYNLANLDDIVVRSGRLLTNSGVLYGDLQIFGDGPDGAPPEGMAKLIYGFDGFVIDFPKMEILANRNEAVRRMSQALTAGGFDITKAEFTTEPYDPARGEQPAGMITVARR